MKYLLIIGFALLSFGTLMANEGDSLSSQMNAGNADLFRQGNEAYADEHFEKAIEFYRGVLTGNRESAELYFNMGNAYFKMGDLPNAILHYEKARKLDPADDDIKTNLDIANLKTVDKVEAKPELPFSAWWKTLLNTNLVDEWASKSIYLSFLAFAIMLIFLFTNGLVKKISFFAGAFVFAISMVFFLLGMQQRSMHENSRYGIIFSPSVTVKSAPEADGTRLFVIHEGTKIEILDEREDWTEISLMNGNKGWLKTEVFRPI